MYAVITTGGKQYQVEPGTVFSVEKLKVKTGEEAIFDKVLLLNDDETVKVGTPYLDAVKVYGTVLENGKAPKVVVFKYKSKKNYRKKQGHRQPYTKVEIDSFEDDGVEIATKPIIEAVEVEEEKEIEAEKVEAAVEEKPRTLRDRISIGRSGDKSKTAKAKADAKKSADKKGKASDKKNLPEVKTSVKAQKSTTAAKKADSATKKAAEAPQKKAATGKKANESTKSELTTDASADTVVKTVSDVQIQTDDTTPDVRTQTVDTVADTAVVTETKTVADAADVKVSADTEVVTETETVPDAADVKVSADVEVENKSDKE